MTRSLLLLSLALWTLLADGAATAELRRPNVVLLFVDDLGYGSLGCYGQTKIATPRLDRMAAEGMKFTQMYAGCHVCQPSRSVLMTGQHTGHTPIRANDANQMLLPDDVTLAEVLKDAGYDTALFGKWGLGYEGTTGHPHRQGFDRFFGQLLQVHAHFQYVGWLWDGEERFELTANHGRRQDRYTQDEVQARAIEWLSQRGERPFFAFLSYILPHVELVVPEDSRAPYRGKFPDRPILDTRAGYLGSEEDGYATLAGMVSRLDRYAGEVLDLLKEKGWDDNTIVIFTSDNGAQSGGKDAGWTAMTDFFQANGPLRGYKGTWYEGGLRVPCIVRWPGQVPAGKTVDTITGFHDFLPTIAELAGAKPPANIDGISLAPTLLGREVQPGHDLLYWEYPVGKSGEISRAARLGRWKAVQNRPNAAVELYDLQTDLSETKNLADQHPEIVRNIVAKMDAEHVPQRDYPPVAPRTGVNDYVK